MLKHFNKNDAINNVEKIYELRHELNEAILERKRLEKEYLEADDNVNRIEGQIHDCMVAIKREATDFDMYDDGE